MNNLCCAAAFCSCAAWPLRCCRALVERTKATCRDKMNKSGANLAFLCMCQYWMRLIAIWIHAQFYNLGITLITLSCRMPKHSEYSGTPLSPFPKATRWQKPSTDCHG
jgi:hypothetical protein